MAGRIPESFIQDLLARTDIVEVVDSRVPLKKAGKNYHACCPFHSEKSPSFTVSADKQFYHCFGCGAHGSAIGFMMEFEGLSFVEAIEDLAKDLSLEVPREQHGKGSRGPKKRTPQAGEQDPFELLESIEAFYHNQLKQPAGQVAVSYLKQRGLSGDIAKRFGIGFAPPGWDNVQRRFAQSQVLQKQLTELGMLIAKEGGSSGRPYDRFRERIMFPIRNRRGKCIGFGGRVLGDEKPKYLNSPETSLFSKGRELYGLYEARQANRQLSRLVVVEGYMDVVALAQHGVDNAVATLGTSATADHLRTLYRLVPEVVLCFDGDNAGRDAAWRAMNNALPVLEDGRTLKFVFLPDGEDPDSMVRKQGREAFEQLLDQSQALSDYLFEQLVGESDVSSTDGRAGLGKKALALIAKLPDGVLRQMLREKLARMLGTSEQSLEKWLGAPTISSADGSGEGRRRTAGGSKPLSLVARAISLLLQRPDRALDLPQLQSLQSLEMPGLAIWLQLCQQARQAPGMSTAQLLELWREHRWADRLAELAMVEHAGSDEAQDDEFFDIVEQFFTACVKQRVQQLLARERALGLNDTERQELVALLAELKAG